MKKKLVAMSVVIVLCGLVQGQDGSFVTGVLTADVGNRTVLEIRTPQNLRCDIKVMTHKMQSIEANYRIWANAKSSEQENRFIKLIEIKLDNDYERDGALRIRILAPTMAPWEGTDYKIGTDLKIQVPLDFEIDSRSMYGKVSIDGPLNVAKVDCEYGSVDVRGINDETNIKTSYSDVDINGLRGYVNIEAMFSNINASEIDILDGTGMFRSANGEIILKNIKGSLEASTSNSNIKAENLTANNIDTDAGSIVMRTSYGNIEGQKLIGELVVESSYGALDLDSVYMPYGMSKFETKFSPIDVMISEMGDAQLLVNDTYSSVNLNVPQDISSKLTLTVDRGGKIHTRGLSIKPIVMESDRLVGMAGNGISKIEANVDGIGEINIQGR